ncbi:PH domain-containing protein [Candidatus Nomurabacteria bacterium]|nr:PH domain-containing protein [Candidatus Nomurabacteria bacterium]
MSVLFEKDEYVIYEARRHWFLLISQGIIILAFLLIPPLLHYLIFKTNIILLTSEGHLGSAILFFYTLWLLGLWISLMLFWTDYYLDVLIITNKRIIDIDQKALFKREISYLSLSKVQDVKSNVDGIFATLLKFGDLSIQTAGKEREFIFKYIKDPNHVREKLDQALRNTR